MARKIQFLLEGFSSSSEFGGGLSQGKRKEGRPIVTKSPMHVVLKASAARGRKSLLMPGTAARVRLLMERYSHRFQVRVLRFENVGTHLHLLTQAKTRKGFQNFLRSLTGQLAVYVTGSVKGKKLKGRFWDGLAFSRVVVMGRAFQTIQRYLDKNQQESEYIYRKILVGLGRLKTPLSMLW